MVDPPDIHLSFDLANARHQPYFNLHSDRDQVKTSETPHRNQEASHHATATAFTRNKRSLRPTSLILLLVTICVAFFTASTSVSASVLPVQDNAPQQTNGASTVHLNINSLDSLSADFLDANRYPVVARDDATELIQRLVALRNARDQPSQHLLRRASTNPGTPLAPHLHTYSKRDDLSEGQRIGYGIVVPILVILSGIFAGLTLGLMALDETQLQVLSSTGTEKQKRAAQKIVPIRKDGHLLLTTLLIANMITNETLPVVSEPLFPSKVLAVVVPTVLIIIFAELVPQSVCSRYGLEIGAFMALPVRIVIIILWPIAFPVSRVLHWTLGPHHGIVYRRSELKELVTMHAASGGRGGDLKGDTVMMVGGALDLQEKVAKEAMTPIDRVFMLSLDAKLDYPTLEQVVRSGHSRIPIYQEVDVPVSMKSGTNTPSKRGLPTFLNALTRRGTATSAKQLSSPEPDNQTTEQQQQHPQSPTNTETLNAPSANAGSSVAPPPEMVKRKKIVGTLLVKSCVLLDPEDAVPVSEMTINALPSVPNDEPLLNVLNAFQEGRSHMAIVTALSRSQSSIDPAAVKGLAAKNNLHPSGSAPPRTDGLSDIDEERQIDTFGRKSSSGNTSDTYSSGGGEHNAQHKLRGFWKKHFGHEGSLEQTAPSDATLSDRTANIAADELSSNARGDILGIITLEDVLEELIGEEIYDEYDPREDGDGAWNNVTPPLSPDGPQAPGPADASLEKKMIDANASVALPPPALNAPTGDGSAAKEKQEQATSKSLLGRLGFSGRKGGASASREQGAATTTSPESIAVDDLATEKSGMASVPDAPLTGVSNDTHADEGPDYLNALAAGTPNEVETPAVPSEPTRPNALPSHLLPTKSASRPSSPGAALPQGDQAATHQPHPLASPQPSRPVMLRKQRPDGSTQNLIVGEHLLRGRKVAPGTPIISVAGGASGNESMGAIGDSGSRSSTPKPSRFKSTPVQAGSAQPRARSMSTEPRRQNTGASEGPSDS